MLIEYDDNKNIVAVLTYIYSTIIKNSENIKAMDIEYIFVEGLGDYGIMNQLITVANCNNIGIITMVDQYYNKYFISRYEMVKGMDLYYHLYNVHLEKVDNYKMCFNLL